MQLIIEYYGPRSGTAYESWKKEAWEVVRKHRDFLIKETDWTQVSDAPISSSEKEKVSDYRKKLRDIPQLGIDPDKVVWPEKPTI